MSLVRYINSFCPLGVSHIHGPNLNSNKVYPDGCAICVDGEKRKNFYSHR